MRLRESRWILSLLLVAPGDACEAATPGRTRALADGQADGRELFTRAWEPGVRGPHGGDGLGPVYNAKSCVDCHFQGGVGGAGPNPNNVDLITATRVQGQPDLGLSTEDREKLSAIHEGFQTETSVVVHRFGTDRGHEGWRGLCQDLLRPSPQRIGAISIAWTQRNTPALFGDGRIDAIPDEALVAEADRGHPDFPEITGRASRLEDGRVGKFGWKAQTASLDDFVRSACSQELGLEVPGHRQAKAPRDRDDHVPGLDLTGEECGSLARFVGELPAPARRKPSRDEEALFVAAGERTFTAIGCMTCHASSVGPVAGIYSDLLLHDMGPGLSGAGYYGGGQPSSPGLAAEAREWRTPPLWGVADSAPYLHDGRATTLAEAIQAHGGEAEATASRFAKLKRHQRETVIVFLSSLSSPGARPRPFRNPSDKGQPPRPNRR